MEYFIDTKIWSQQLAFDTNDDKLGIKCPTNKRIRAIWFNKIQSYLCLSLKNKIKHNDPFYPLTLFDKK
jgi:hypothetical protein